MGQGKGYETRKTPNGKQGRNTLRCNTDLQTTTRKKEERTRKANQKTNRGTKGREETEKTEEDSQTGETNKGKRDIKRQKQIEYNSERKPLVNMENGFRTLNVASLNPDSFKEQTTQQEIINELTKKKDPNSNNTRDKIRKRI